jgi:hypothetical protein
MEINEIIINEDPQIKSLSQEELILYNYLNNENKIKIKSDLASQISALKQIKETSPKVAENNKKNENLKPENDLIQEYFNEKNRNSKNISNNIIYTVDDIQKEKENLEKNIKEKKEAEELLKQLKIANDNKKVTSDLIKKIKSNNILSKNKNLKDFISKISTIKIKEDEIINNLTEEQKIIISFRNLIKNSYKEAINNMMEETTILTLFKELNLEEIDLKKIIKENEDNNDNNKDKNKDKDKDIICKDEKIKDFINIINITSSFNVFIKELHKYNPYNTKNSDIFYKIINLLLSRYDSYSLSNNENIFALALTHNNLEYLTYLLNYYILFYSEHSSHKKDEVDNINKSLFNIVIKIKNLSIGMFSQVLAHLNEKVKTEMENIESFKDIMNENIFNSDLKSVNNSLELIFSFFEKLRIIALHREVIFHFNTVLKIFFELLNQKILKVDEYALDDIQGLLNLSQEIIKNMKLNFEKISSKDMDLSVKFMNILEQNMEYLKFQELLFILNSNLKQIKNYLVSKNHLIYIRKHQFEHILRSTFNKSEKLDELINIINTFVKERNNLN